MVVVWLLLLPVLAERPNRSRWSAISGAVATGESGRIALAIGAAGLAHQWDDELRGHIDSELLGPLLDFDNYYFGTKSQRGSVAGVWALSRVAGMEEVHGASGEVLRALVLVAGTVEALKIISGRTRPDGSNAFSFPSGHSANAFAMATVLGRRYGRAVGVPLLALAATVAAARIHDRHHYLSDVVAGSIMGIVAGWAVDRDGDGLTLAPVLARRPRDDALRWRY